MHLNQIHSFLAISRTLNFTSAARQLGIPQSTISRQVSDLEKQLGVRLFYRTRRDVRLTDEGRAFLPFAREMADAAQRGTHAVQQLREGASGHLSIAAIPAASRRLTLVLDAFHRKYPDIIIDLAPLSAGFTLMDDVDSPHDFYFLYRDMMADSEEYDEVSTHQETIGLVMSRTYLEQVLSGDSWEASCASSSGTSSSGTLSSGASSSAGRKSRSPAGLPSAAESLSPEILSRAGYILLSETADPILYMQAMNYCRTHRFSPRIVNAFSDVSSVLLSLRSGMGISFLPRSLAEDAGGEDLVFLPLDEKSYTLPCIAAWKKSLLNPAASLFLDMLRQTVASE